MSDYKLAADAIRSLAVWKGRALRAEEKVAAFTREKRVDELLKQADLKNVKFPEDLDLMKCSEEHLRDLERSLSMINPQGGIKLGSVEGGAGEAEADTTPTKQLSELDEYLFNPNFQTGF